jgi:NAD-dependent dihydropyrimidine dehydrogenase PreA subunit
MAKKILKATFENRCIGCELCVLEVQRQLGRVGLLDSPIRILREKSMNSIFFHVEIDPRVNSLNLKEIIKVCPTLVFEIVEVSEDEDNYIS